MIRGVLVTICLKSLNKREKFGWGDGWEEWVVRGMAEWCIDRLSNI